MRDYFAKLATSATTFLNRWDGARVRVWQLTPSHRTLWIVLYRDAEMWLRHNLVFSGDPLWMHGPFEWDRATLGVEVVVAAETPAAPFVRPRDDRLFRLHDPVGFEFLTASLEVAENVHLD